VKRLPDFVIIGAMKCATSTLHEQLALQPGIFMSTPKEPNFFSNDEIWAHGMYWYQSLFDAAPVDAICGESSTHYTKLPTYPQTVSRMQKHLGPRCRFIYVMRHPIDRLVSQYVHEWTQRVISEPINQAIDLYPELIDYSRYSRQLRPFLETFGHERVLPVFFDRLSSKPQLELERVCQFIGYRLRPRWEENLEEQNVSSERMRRSAWRDAVTDLPGVTWLRRTLVPQSIRDRIKRLWMMKRRPELSLANVEKLKSIFNEDLRTLGDWLGMDLDCDNFRTLGLEAIPTWRMNAKVGVR
jgi:hypothetical protein